MLRTTIVLASLVALTACDRAASTEPAARAPLVVGSTPTARQGIRGILRRDLAETPENQWRLEKGDGTTFRLVGGPLSDYYALENKEVFVVGVVGGADLVVESCDEDTRIYREFNRRR